MYELYIIYSQEQSDIEGEPMYWSNLYGWTTLPSATLFDEEDKKELHLPIGGKWEVFGEFGE